MFQKQNSTGCSLRPLAVCLHCICYGNVLVRRNPGLRKEEDQRNFYKEQVQLANAVLRPVVSRVSRLALYGGGVRIQPDFQVYYCRDAGDFRDSVSPGIQRSG